MEERSEPAHHLACVWGIWWRVAEVSGRAKETRRIKRAFLSAAIFELLLLFRFLFSRHGRQGYFTSQYLLLETAFRFYTRASSILQNDENVICRFWAVPTGQLTDMKPSLPSAIGCGFRNGL
ncbi:hypothetical protein ACLOJK_016137 [Asimina triloba]